MAFVREALDDHFAEIAQILDELSQSGHVMFGHVVPGVGKFLLATLRGKGRSTVGTLECKAGNLSDRVYGSAVVIAETVALKSTPGSMGGLHIVVLLSR